MEDAQESPSSFLSQLKFRVAQPVDIPRCHELECLAYPPEAAASKSTLQQRQHHAAPFFRCVLLKNAGAKPKREKHPFAMLDEGESEGAKREGNTDEACHHVHHSTQNQLIGYVCATACHDAAPSTEPEFRASTDGRELSSNILSEKFQPPPMKHEPNGRYLVINSVVVQKEYQGLGLTRALLQYYINSIELYCAELDEAGKNRRRNKIPKNSAKIEKILLLSKSSMAHVFISVGFRWRATVMSGEDPLYELERDVEIIPPPSGTSLSFPDLQPYSLAEQYCFLVDAFAFSGGNGNPAAIVVLQDCPAKLIAGYYNNIDTDHPHNMTSNGSERGEHREMINIVRAARAVQKEGELAEIRADSWMKAVAKEFNQPTTAFVWPISLDNSGHGLVDSSSLSDDELNLSYHDEGSNHGLESQSDANYFISLFSGAGMEVDMCSHATLAAASVLFCQYDSSSKGVGRTLSFHSGNDIVLQTFLWEEPCQSLPSSPTPASPKKWSSRLVTQGATPHTQPNSVRIAMDCPWRTVEPAAPGEGQAVLAVLRRAFFRAWSVAPDENNDDDETDEMAFSLSSHHIKFVGVISQKEDLLIELTVDGFDMISGRNADLDALKQGCSGYTRGVIVCSEVPESVDADAVSEDILNTSVDSDGDNTRGFPEGIHFRSRYFHFASSCEDPASGWSHCALGPYFGLRRGIRRLIGLQTSERGGLVECILKESEQKVCILGTAVTTMRGKTLMRV